MAHFDAYLEYDPAGACTAHVLTLPGCFTSGKTRAAALAALPDAVRAYHAWLRRHGTDVPDPAEPVTVAEAEASEGLTLHQRGGKAALFSPDRLPVARGALDGYFARAGYSRADLLAMAGDLPDYLLDWQADRDAMTIREILRHVGNAEEWYVSRLVAPPTLPPEWEHDAGLPIIQFLEMERRTVRERFGQMTETELAEVRYPTEWTRHPEEPWTARKALRRLLEHEREHCQHVREVLEVHRARLLADLAAARAGLLLTLVDLPEEALTQQPVMAQWTAKDLLAHVAAWDALFTKRIEAALAGALETAAVVDLDARNAVVYAERKDWTLQQALDAFEGERQGFLAALARVSLDDLHRLRRPAWGLTTIRQWTEWRARHDQRHAADLDAWRKATKPETFKGPKPVLLAAVRAGWAELLAAIRLVDSEERETRTLVGDWTLKDLLGHVADWDQVAVDGFRRLAAGETPQADDAANVEQWNARETARRRSQPWTQVWSDSQAAHTALLAGLENLGEEALARSFRSPWTELDTAYVWGRVWLEHYRGHAADLRAAYPAL